jgi:hypothetical protein
MNTERTRCLFPVLLAIYLSTPQSLLIRHCFPKKYIIYLCSLLIQYICYEAGTDSEVVVESEKLVFSALARDLAASRSAAFCCSTETSDWTFAWQTFSAKIYKKSKRITILASNSVLSKFE